MEQPQQIPGQPASLEQKQSSGFRRKIFIVAGVIILLIVGIVVLVFQLTSGLVEVSDSFFLNIRERKSASAYDQLSNQRKNNYPLKEFRFVIEEQELQSVVDTSWSSRNIQNDVGQLDGTLTLKDGSVIPYYIVFVKENGSWKIDDFSGFLSSDERSLASTVSVESTTVVGTKVIDDEQLIQETMLEFKEAVEQKDFSDFYQNIAPYWQEQTSAEEMGEAFNAFYDKELILAPISEGIYTFDADIDQESGKKMVNGTATNEAFTITYSLEYVQDDDNWLLTAIFVNVE